MAARRKRRQTAAAGLWHCSSGSCSEEARGHKRLHVSHATKSGTLHRYYWFGSCAEPSNTGSQSSVMVYIEITLMCLQTHQIWGHINTA